ncbi:MAG: sulfotransferase, partial [Anaerolineaceae bacterium]|nr:sulfotransferase [Anaerolineaceae bacterium]
MIPNIKLFFRTVYFSFFKSEGTPGRLSPKRFFVLLFIFIFYPLWHYSFRLAYSLDNLFFPNLKEQDIKQPIFIIGNFRSGTTLLHRLLVKDERTTGMQSWEIYLAPSVIQRKLIHWIMKINRLVGNPIAYVLKAFDKALQEYSYMHPTGLQEIEEDSHVLLHIWSTYDLFAFFPFPELIRNYIYYDDAVSEGQKKIDMTYYREVLKRHIYTNPGKRYISKSPSFSAKVRTLHEQFPDAKFINLMRSPKSVIPSSVSMYANHWRTYGDPEEEFPQTGPKVIMEQARHWYIYPHRYLKTLPENQYILVQYEDLVQDPEAAIEQIYTQFGIEMTPEFQQILHAESEKSKKYKSHHEYSLGEMGLSDQQIEKQVRTP